MDVNEFLEAVQKDVGSLCEETDVKDDVIRGMLTNLGVGGSAAILEVCLEGAQNGSDLPYPVLRFHITLAKDIDKELYKDVTFALNQLNTVIASGEYPSIGNFCLYMPLGQIFMSYRMPINTDCLEGEVENVRFFLGTVYEQLDIFADMVMFIANGNELVTMDEYLRYLKTIQDFENLEERAKKLADIVDKLA